MFSSLTFSLVLAALFANTPSADWQGPQGEYVFVEAESFRVEGGGWASAGQIYSPRDETVASGNQALSGHLAGNGLATYEFNVPQAGDYKLWIRYAQWPDPQEEYRDPFELAVSQNGQPVTLQTLDRQYSGPTFARSFFVYTWEAIDVTLVAGKTRYVLSKAKASAIRAKGTRFVPRVDCLLLTTDQQYKPEYRDFGPQTFLRFRLRDSLPEQVVFYGFLNHMRRPYYQSVNFSKTGYQLGPRQLKLPSMSAGEETPWINISRLLNADSDTMFTIQATVDFHQPDASESSYTIDIATAPQDAAIVKTFDRKGPGAGLMFRMPAELSGDQRPKADYEFAAERLQLTEALPPITFGKRPQRFPFLIDLPATPERSHPDVRRMEHKSLAYLGINGVGGSLDDEDIAAGLVWHKAHTSVWYMGAAGFNEPDSAKLTHRMAVRGAEFAKDPHTDRLVHLQLMDEVAAKRLELMVKSEVDQQAFVTWLKQHGHTPAKLGVEDWSQVRMTADRQGPTPALYLESQRFRAWSVVNFFKNASDLAHANMPASVRTTQNFTDMAVYIATMFNRGNDYFTWFENKALDVALSEDWCNHQTTRQLAGWNVAVLRAATRKHRQPIHMYLITAFNRRPLDVKLKAYSDIAQGAKSLQLYAFSPEYANHEGGWARRWEMFPAIAELTREVGAAEHILMDAMPVPAETAIIYSRPYDIWNAGLDNTFGQERMMTYLALRHAQVPVDVVSDADVSHGILDQYKIAYLHGEQIETDLIAPLAEFVRRGGTLVLAPGAGSRDQLNQPLAELDRSLGIQRGELERMQGYLHTSRYLFKILQPKGNVVLDGGKTITTYGSRQSLQPRVGAQTWAAFADNEMPAVVSQPTGKGSVVMVGFCPAIAYMHEAWGKAEASGEELVPHLPSAAMAMEHARQLGLEIAPHLDAPQVRRLYYTKNAYDYTSHVRDLIVAPALQANVTRPVDVDTPVVEATLLASDDGWVVPLANYTGGPLERINVKLRSKRSIGIVHSARLGTLDVRQDEDGVLQVTLPLESTDMLFGEWR